MNDARKVVLRVEIKSRKGLTASYLGITAHFFPPKPKVLVPTGFMTKYLLSFCMITSEFRLAPILLVFVLHCEQ